MPLSTCRRNHTAAFADRDDLVRFDVRKPLHLLGDGLLDFDDIDNLELSQAKVEAQVSL